MFLCLGIGGVVLSLSNPLYGKQEVKAQNRGLDIMVALDISKSMEANDLSKNRSRLEVASIESNSAHNKNGTKSLGGIISNSCTFTTVFSNSSISS